MHTFSPHHLVVGRSFPEMVTPAFSFRRNVWKPRGISPPPADNKRIHWRVINLILLVEYCGAHGTASFVFMNKQERKTNEAAEKWRQQKGTADGRRAIVLEFIQPNTNGKAHTDRVWARRRSERQGGSSPWGERELNVFLKKAVESVFRLSQRRPSERYTTPLRSEFVAAFRPPRGIRTFPSWEVWASRRGFP